MCSTSVTGLACENVSDGTLWTPALWAPPDWCVLDISWWDGLQTWDDTWQESGKLLICLFFKSRGLCVALGIWWEDWIALSCTSGGMWIVCFIWGLGVVPAVPSQAFLPLHCRNDEKLDLQWTLEGHQLGVVSVDISHTGAIAASSSLDAHIRLWDLDTGKQIKSIDAGPGESPVLSWLCRKHWHSSGTHWEPLGHWGVPGIELSGGCHLFCVCRSLTGFMNSPQSSIRRTSHLFLHTTCASSGRHSWLFVACIKQNGKQLALHMYW